VHIENQNVPQQARGRIRPFSKYLILWTLAFVTILAVPGCSLGVMFGKMFLGDPKVKSQFRTATGVDLTKGEKSILITCSAPHSVLSRYPSIQIDILDRMSRHLETRNVKIISSDKVSSWFDDHGDWGDFSELAENFSADYVMNIQIEVFRLDVPDSSNLQQGKINGNIQVLDCQSGSAPATAFERRFNLAFPDYPVPKENKSERLFTEQFQDRVSLTLAQFLYDHRVSETVH